MIHIVRTFIFLVVMAITVTACTSSTAVHVDSVKPESLLDLSSERVTFSLDLPEASDELTEWINNDQPSRANIHCSEGEKCTEAEFILSQFGVPFENMGDTGSGNEVILFYDRIFSRDCGTEGAETFGCSVSANMVQMVADPRQFLDPALLDLQDAEKASNVFDSYLGK